MPTKKNTEKSLKSNKEVKTGRKAATTFIDLKISEQPVDGMHQFLEVSSYRKETLENYKIDPKFIVQRWEGKRSVSMSISTENYIKMQKKIKSATLFFTVSGEVKGVHRHFVKIEHQSNIFYIHFIIDAVSGTHLLAKFNTIAKKLETKEPIKFRFNSTLNCIFIDEKGYLDWRQAALLKHNIPEPMTAQEYIDYVSKKGKKYNINVPKEVELLERNEVDLLSTFEQRAHRFHWQSPSFTPYKNNNGKYLVNENYDACVITHCKNLNAFFQKEWGFENFLTLEFNELNKPIIVIDEVHKIKLVNKINERAILGKETVPWVTRSFFPIYNEQGDIISYRHYSFNYQLRPKGFLSFLSDNAVNKSTININYVPKEHYCEIDPDSYDNLLTIFQKRYYNAEPFTLKNLIDFIKKHGGKHNVSVPRYLNELYKKQTKIHQNFPSENCNSSKTNEPIEQPIKINHQKTATRKRIINDPMDEDTPDNKKDALQNSTYGTLTFFGGVKIKQEKIHSNEALHNQTIQNDSPKQSKAKRPRLTESIASTAASLTHFATVKIKQETAAKPRQREVDIESILEQMRHFLNPYTKGQKPPCSLVTKVCMETLEKLILGEQVDQFTISRLPINPRECNQFEQTEFEIAIKNEKNYYLGMDTITHERILAKGHFANLPPLTKQIINLEHPEQFVTEEIDLEPAAIQLQTFHYTRLRHEILNQAQKKNAILIGQCSFDDYIDDLGHVICFLATKQNVYFFEPDQNHPTSKFDVIFNELTDVYMFGKDANGKNDFATLRPYCRFLTLRSINAEIKSSVEQSFSMNPI